MEELYSHFRSASGFTLIILGLSVVVEPGRKRIGAAVGALFSICGVLFLWSAFSKDYPLPAFLDSLILLALLYGVSQCLLEISLYLLGGPYASSTKRTIYIVGAVWCVAVWLLPLLDLAFGLGSDHANVEDGRGMGPFYLAATAASYVWPIAVSVLSFHVGRWSPKDLPLGPGAVRAILIGLAAGIAGMGLAIVGMAMDSLALYRLSHVALQITFIGWYFYYRRHPQVFTQARAEIKKEFKKHNRFTPQETERIKAALHDLVDRKRVYEDPNLDLAGLAKQADVPAYRLSAFLNVQLDSSFSDWLNDVRIEHARALLARNAEATILEIALDAGYSSKTAFNTQFLRRVGMKPSEYRASLADKAG